MSGILKKGPNSIRVYCSKCNGLIQESKFITKKEIRKIWDEMVLSSPLIHRCSKCKSSMPNIDIYFKIYRQNLNKEQTPEEFGIKAPKEVIDEIVKECK